MISDNKATSQTNEVSESMSIDDNSEVDRYYDMLNECDELQEKEFYQASDLDGRYSSLKGVLEDRVQF